MQTGYHHQGKFDVTDWLPTIVSAALSPDSASTWRDFIPKYWNNITYRLVLTVK